MREARNVLLVVAMALVVAVAGAADVLAATMVLRAADDHPMDYPTTQGLKYIADRVRELTNGRIEIQIFPSAQLGSETKTIEMTQFGALDINRVSIAPVTQFVPAMGVFAMPYLFRDEAHYWKVLNGPIGAQMLKELEKANLIGLAYYDSGARSFYTTRKPIYTPADLKGLKIRVQRSQVMMDVVQALGATPVPMEFEEVYSALQTGVIDGAENNPPSLAISTSHYEVTRYYTLDEHVRIPEVVLVSAITWNKLSPQDQAALRQAAQESVAVQRHLWRAYEERAMAKLRERGIQIIVPDKAAFQEAARAVWEKYRPQFGSLIDEIVSAR